MTQFFTTFVKQVDGGFWVAQCVEISNAHAQGTTEEEALENLKEVIKLLADCNKEELKMEGFVATKNLLAITV